MARGAGRGGSALLVAVDTSLHRRGQLHLQSIMPLDLSVAGGAADLRLMMPGVAEDHDSRQTVDALGGEDRKRAVHMADRASGRSGKPGGLGRGRANVATHARVLERRVPLMAERWFGRRHEGRSRQGENREECAASQQTASSYCGGLYTEVDVRCIDDCRPQFRFTPDDWHWQVPQLPGNEALP